MLRHARRIKLGDRETITAELAAKQCRTCGNIGAGMTFAFMDTPHFARLNCNACGAFIEWVGMPGAPPKRGIRTYFGHYHVVAAPL